MNKYFLNTSFILTIWNVKVNENFDGDRHIDGFILTIWNVNQQGSISELRRKDSFILTIWNVKIRTNKEINIQE